MTDRTKVWGDTRLNVDLADSARQDKVQSAVSNLLIVLQRFHQDWSRERANVRQLSDRSDAGFDPGGLGICNPPQFPAKTRRPDHSPSHSFTMSNLPIARGGFDRVTQRVAKIQNPTQVAFLLIRSDDVHLN